MRRYSHMITENHVLFVSTCEKKTHVFFSSSQKKKELMKQFQMTQPVVFSHQQQTVKPQQFQRHTQQRYNQMLKDRKTFKISSIGSVREDIFRLCITLGTVILILGAFLFLFYDIFQSLVNYTKTVVTTRKIGSFSSLMYHILLLYSLLVIMYVCVLYLQIYEPYISSLLENISFHHDVSKTFGSPNSQCLSMKKRTSS